eukprot:6204724-Pleurochrysis_carterae.AAC.3
MVRKAGEQRRLNRAQASIFTAVQEQPCRVRMLLKAEPTVESAVAKLQKKARVCCGDGGGEGFDAG